MIKHFILSGLTLQMMLDVTLYFTKYASVIDSVRFWNTMNGLHYGKLMNGILWAMIQFCGFSVDDFPGIDSEAPEQIDAILSDLEEGGWMGTSDRKTREEGWYEYNHQKLVRERSKMQYLLYMLRWKWAQYMNALFPTVDELAKRYPYVHKNAFLIPFAWTHRLIFRGIRTLRKGVLTQYIVTDESKLNAQGKNRVELFKSLEMM